MASATYSEFALHVHKKCGDEEHADLYTIGLWEQSGLRGICHAEPIDKAVAAFRTLLHEAGKRLEYGGRRPLPATDDFVGRKP